MRKLQFSITASLAIVALASSLLIPVPLYVRCDFHVQPRGATSVYVDVPGAIESICARAGQRVQAGQDLVLLDNLEIRLALARLEGDREELNAKLESLRLRAYSDEAALLEMAEVQESRAALESRMDRRRDDLRRLRIQAPADGLVFAAPVPAVPHEAQRLPTWSGHPLEQDNLGAFMPEGVTICQIGNPKDLGAVLTIDENTMRFIRAGQKVELYPQQMRGRRLSGAIKGISTTEMDVSPVRFSTDPRVDPHRSDPSRRSQRPTTLYQANLPLSIGNQEVVVGGRGKAKIHAGSRPLGSRLWDYLSRTFHFEM